MLRNRLRRLSVSTARQRDDPWRDQDHAPGRQCDGVKARAGFVMMFEAARLPVKIQRFVTHKDAPREVKFGGLTKSEVG